MQPVRFLCFFLLARGSADDCAGDGSKTFAADEDGTGVNLLQTEIGLAPVQLEIVGLAPLRKGDRNDTEEPIDRPTPKVMVEFGVLWKNFYGIHTDENSFEVDMILMTSWYDPRTSKLIPSGSTELRLAGEEAAGQMWLPKVKVTNGERAGVEIISTSYLLKDDKVMKMERASIEVKGNFVYDNFPFDTQDLLIRVASATYMADEVELVPTQNTSMWGADAKLLPKEWEFKKSELFSFVDVDGGFTKSRGVLNVRAKRSPSRYISSVFVPSTMLFLMACTALWLPLLPPFVMPRVALNAIALLSQVTLAMKVGSLTPSGYVTWMDDYIEAIFTLQFIALLLNACVLSFHHKLNDPDADKLDKELAYILPSVWLVTMICMFIGPYLYVRPSCLTRIVLIGFAGYYYYKHVHAKLVKVYVPEEDAETKNRRGSVA